MPTDELEQLVRRNAHEQDWLVMLDHFGAGYSPVAIDTSKDTDGLTGITDISRFEDVAGDGATPVGGDRRRRAFEGTEAICAGEDIGWLHVSTVGAEAGCHEA